MIVNGFPEVYQEKDDEKKGSIFQFHIFLQPYENYKVKRDDKKGMIKQPRRGKNKKQNNVKNKKI